MTTWTRTILAGCLALVAVLVLTGCAAGPGSEWSTTDMKAGFWAGLWHGALMFVALIVSFFAPDTVSIYEPVNTGVAYNIGFVLGVLAVYGGGARIHKTKTCRSEQDWDEIGGQVERKFKAKVQAWVESEDDGTWEELGEQVQRKVKQKIRRWLDEEDVRDAPR